MEHCNEAVIRKVWRKMGKNVLKCFEMVYAATLNVF